MSLILDLPSLCLSVRRSTAPTSIYCSKAFYDTEHDTVLDFADLSYYAIRDHRKCPCRISAASACPVDHYRGPELLRAWHAGCNSDVYPVYWTSVQSGLPTLDLRPGMVIAIGPPSFTALAIIGMANSIPNNFGYFESHPLAYDVVNIIAVFIAIFLWSLSLWFFAIFLLSCVTCIGKMRFQLLWWSSVSPNIGFTIVTITIGTSLESQGITWVRTGMSIIVAGLWLFVLFTHSRAVCEREILFKGNDEDD